MITYLINYFTSNYVVKVDDKFYPIEIEKDKTIPFFIGYIKHGNIYYIYYKNSFYFIIKLLYIIKYPPNKFYSKMDYPELFI